MKYAILNQITETLSRKPEYGILSSMFSITMSATDFLQLIGVLLGLFIAIITAILKVMELRDKIKEKNESKPKRKTRKKIYTDDD